MCIKNGAVKGLGTHLGRAANYYKDRLRQRLKAPVMTSLYFVRFGPRQAVQLLRQRRVARESPSHSLIEFKIGKDVSVWLRAQSHDIDIFEQIVLMRDCRGPRGANPQLIIDGGAHVGCSAVSFAMTYPDAEIIAVEADKNNFDLLQLNTAQFKNVKCVHGAIWETSQRVVIANPSDDPWAFRVRKPEGAADGSIPGITIGELLASSRSSHIGLLKLDIEGAERRVFSAQTDLWLPKTDAIIIELHDRIEAGCSEAFFSAVDRLGFKVIHRSVHNVVVARPI